MANKLTVRDYAIALGISETAVRKQIKKNRLKTCYELRDNRKVLLVENDNLLLKSFESIEQSSEQNKSSQFEQVSKHEETPTGQDFLKVLFEMQHQNSQLVEDVKKYAELAGQAKLLTDSESRTRQEYFKLIQESKNAEKERAELIVKTQLLEKQLVDREELKTKLELSYQRLRELEEQLNQKKQKKSLRKMFKEFVIKTF